MKCFDNFVHSAVSARRQGDEKPNTNVVSETKNLFANSSYGYQTIDRSRYSVLRHMNDDKTHAAISKRMFWRLGYIDDQLCQVRLSESEFEHKEPIIVGCFFLQYARLRNVDLYYKLFTEFCDTDKYEEMEMDTDSLYLTLSEKEVSDRIRSEKRQQWNLLRSKDCKKSLTPDTCRKFFSQTCCAKHKKT